MYLKLFEKSFLYAFLMTLFCSLSGTFLGGLPYLTVIGALVISLVIGMMFQMYRPAIKIAEEGIGFISNKFLRLGIILLGFKLNLIDLANAGVKTILFAVVIVSGMVVLTYNIARKFGVSKRLAILTASGTSICGAAAVMGISPQIKVSKEEEAAKHNEEVLAVAIVAILGTVFTLIEIGLKPMLHMTDTQFGVMAGGSLHEIAHAIATGSAGGSVSLSAAIITKLSRVLMLAPAALVIGIWYQHQDKTATGEKGKLPIPWFMAGFLLASVIGTFVPMSSAVLNLLVKLAYLVLGMAMAALGMSVNFKAFLSSGRNAVLAALSASVILLTFTIIVSKAFF
ncbi:putative sulfate exporter family transporter [Companilactobacillus suantsaicola]|uniref:Putative sulfate exporter family transporter n=1 Tax=Companilactobacillus suantsaicola TaxID=2487723 RepID=A0A4Z0JEH4_9LACO|nr:putative sulfate exporter family transporter [Companilactobacillus suantsaicola]TGD20901.1 putative sulfate exporter family transporter [Companilactobacillus suantsaicola]